MDLAIRSNLPWTGPLTFDNMLPPKTRYHRNNVEIKNSGGYGLRLFTISVAAKPEKTAGESMMKYIAENLNRDTSLKGSVYVVPENLFIEGNEFTTWSDIIGANNALMLMQKTLGTNTSAVDWFETNKQEVFAYFASGTFSPDLCRILHAPTSECFDPTLFAPAIEEPLESEADDAKKKANNADMDDYEDEEDNTLKLN